MTVVGQPKSTSQYIQVTGRVGRKWDKRPGLIVTLYGAAKPRDRSHFERFRSYHQRLYAQVEPTSATPFAPSALDRALHAVTVSCIGENADLSLSPFPFPANLFDEAEQLLLARVAFCDPGEESRVVSLLGKLRKEWDQLAADRLGENREEPPNSAVLCGRQVITRTTTLRQALGPRQNVYSHQRAADAVPGSRSSTHSKGLSSDPKVKSGPPQLVPFFGAAGHAGAG